MPLAMSGRPYSCPLWVLPCRTTIVLLFYSCLTIGFAERLPVDEVELDEEESASSKHSKQAAKQVVEASSPQGLLEVNQSSADSTHSQASAKASASGRSNAVRHSQASASGRSSLVRQRRKQRGSGRAARARTHTDKRGTRSVAATNSSESTQTRVQAKARHDAQQARVEQSSHSGDAQETEHQSDSASSGTEAFAHSQQLLSEHGVSSLAEKATRTRLFGRRTVEAAHQGHVTAVAKTTGHKRWDLATSGGEADEEEDEDLPESARFSRLTEEQQKQMRVLEQELDSTQPANTSSVLGPVAEQPMLLAVAGGIGASVGNTGSINFDRDLIRRMKMQDLVVMCLLLFVYFATLSFSACLAHRQAANRSRVKFYADPRMYIQTVDQAEETAFLEAFNQQPKQAHLRVTGYLPVTNNFPGSFFWRDGLYAVAFSFALDLTPWVARASLHHPEDTDEEDAPEAGVLEEDLRKLRNFLADDHNDMAIIEMRKCIDWACWEELAMNIKHQIRQSGFQGVINIDRTEQEDMCIYKNTQWANFMHGKALKVLLALSVIGWLFYVPYMWIRCTHLPIRCAHRINISVSDYWPYISEGLSANGFLVGDAPQAVFPAHRAQEVDSSDDGNTNSD
mmetsp:Transcript_40851/g.94800  ORF Transcript_40851/g.94800 Transcript_40851/m.94800 type:complete len:624 (+) Transcript_40851:64-1935(+)